jgi:NAD(P)H-dependent flavin oxidoreductase YrpB (nitropropane dioxygenase family)
MLKTRITDLFEISYPIISAPMVRYSGGGLAAAVSSAGGLGTFGAASPANPIGPDYVREQIRHIRSQTDQPFGVGFITHCIEETLYTQVFDIINTAMSDSPPWPEGIAARGYHNAFAQEWHGRENARRDRLDQIIPGCAAARQRHDFNTAPAYFGESASFVHAILEAKEVLSNICEEAERLATSADC